MSRQADSSRRTPICKRKRRPGLIIVSIIVMLAAKIAVMMEAKIAVMMEAKIAAFTVVSDSINVL